MSESHTTPRNAGDPTKNQRRLTVHEAARALGISEDAVRMRVKRGTLPSEREDGRLYVFLTSEPTSEPTDRTDELIDELRDRVRSLEEQLGQERDANRENRRIIAALTSRIPELPSAAPEKPPEAPDTDTESRVEPTPSEPTEGPMAEGAQRSWWRRVFGG